MALLGKISAVLTANTQDFTRRIGESRRELQDFARQARGIQFNLNTRALDGTLTQLQRFQRTLREIQQLQARGVDAGLPNVGRLRDQFRAFEDIGRPLTALKNQIEGLSSSLQAELYPELEKIQAGFRNFYRDIDTGSTTFDRAAARVDNLQRRLQSLSRVTAAVRDVSGLARTLDADNTGASFFQARARESLQRTISLRGQAQNVPAALRGDVFADLSVQAEENAQRIEQAVARVARAQLRIANGGSGGGPTSRNIEARGRAQAELDTLTRRQNAINMSFQREMESVAIQQIVSPGAERQVTLLRERLSGLATELRAINSQQFNGLISGAAAVVEQFNRGAASAKEAKQAVDALAASLNAANTTRDLRQQTESLIFAPRDLARRSIQRDFDRQVAGLAAGDPLRRQAEIERAINLAREGFNAETIPRTQGLAAQARTLGTPDAERQANKLLQINQQINAELTRATNLNRNNDYSEAENRLRRIDALLVDQRRIEAEITDQVEIRNTARRQEELFLGASGGSSEQLSQGARDAASDISVARQFRGQISSGGARIAIQSEIDSVTSGITALQQEMARVAASSMGLDDRVRELDRLDNKIRLSTKGLAAFVAEQSRVSGENFSTQQIEAAMTRSRNTAGSLSVRGAAVAQLALQQGLFAIDDLMSATGPLEYKLRAVGNNITQLGLLLGQSGLIPGLSATTGLFIGLATVVGGQVVTAFLKYAFAQDEAEQRTKSLNEAVSRQKSAVESLAEAYRNLSSEIAKSTATESGKKNIEIGDRVKELRRRAEERNNAETTILSPDVARLRAQRGILESRLEKESDLEQRIRLQSQIDSTRRREQAAIARGVARPTRESIGADLVAAEEASFQGVEARLNRAKLRRDLGIDAPAGEDIATLEKDLESRRKRLDQRRASGAGQTAQEQIAQLREVMSVLEQERSLRQSQIDSGMGIDTKPIDDAIDSVSVSIRRLAASLAPEVQQIADRFSEGALRLSDEVENIQNRASKLGSGGLAVAAQGIGEEIARLVERFSSADTPEAARAIEEQLGPLRAQKDALVAAATSAETAASALERFAEVLDRARQEAQANLQQAQTAADQSRRADLGLSTPQTQLDRRIADTQLQEQQAANARVEQEVAAARERFSQQASQAGPARQRSEAAQRAKNAQDAFLNIAASAGLPDSKTFEEDIAAATAAGNKGLADALQREFDVIRQSSDQLGLERIDWNVVDQAIEEYASIVNTAGAETARSLERVNEINSALATTGVLDQQGRERLVEERARLEQQLIEQDSRVASARDSSTLLAELNASADRGRELMQSPAQRAAQDARQGIADIGRRFDEITQEIIDAGGGLPDRSRIDEAKAQQEEAVKRFADERMRAAAPGIFSMADAVQTAILQGPSRAALRATDASTVEGQAELNRLLRGDDSSRDQNLAELQRQNETLKEVATGIKDMAEKMGIVLDL
jgi:hypothetical protein